MLADAVRSEAYRFSRNRMAVFWSVLFVPLFIVVVGAAVQLFTKARTAEMQAAMPPELSQPGGPMATSGPLDLGAELVNAVGGFANPVVLLFVLIGASILYAGDYRWETWRLISARNARPNLILGKVLVLLGVILAAFVGWMIAALINELIKSAVFARPLTFGFGADDAGKVAAFAALTVTRVLQFTMIGLLAAVLTRSLLAALFVPLVVAVGQFFLMQALPLMALEPTGLTAQLLVPGLATDTLKAIIEGSAADAPAALAWKAAGSLAVWTVVPLVAAVAWFQRQDLSKE